MKYIIQAEDLHNKYEDLNGISNSSTADFTEDDLILQSKAYWLGFFRALKNTEKKQNRASIKVNIVDPPAADEGDITASYYSLYNAEKTAMQAYLTGISPIEDKPITLGIPMAALVEVQK